MTKKTTKLAEDSAVSVKKSDVKKKDSKKSESKSKKPSKKSESKSKKSSVVEDKKVVEEEVKAPVKRVPVTKDSVLNDFNELIASVEDEIKKNRSDSNKPKGIKFLRTLNKKIKALRNNSGKLMKQKNKSTRRSNNNSGFLKPVKISDEITSFFKWDAGVEKSRVDVTKAICEYIKNNNLQNPEDKRQIMVDAKLSKLLGYDPKKESEPLTYYRLQTFLKKHFKKDDSN